MRKISIILLVSALCIGCSSDKKLNKECLLLDDVKYVSSIPKLVTLCEDSMTSVITPTLQIRNFAIVDSLLFIDTDQENGILNIMSIVSGKSFGSFLDKGRAKGEFGFGINLNLYTTFDQHKDSLFANLYDLIAGRLYRVNITKQIIEGECDVQEISMPGGLPRSAFWVKTVSDTLVYYRTIDKMETCQPRTIITQNGRISTKVTNKLNEFEIPAKEDFNIISSLIAFSPSKNMFVEAMIGMNYINIYSLHEDKGYTLCIGKELDKLSSILSTSKYDRKYIFADLRVYDFGIAALKYDIDEKVYLSDGEYYPSILMFDWNGNPIGEITSEVKFNHFDFDLKNGFLYILDKEGRLLKRKCNFIPKVTK